MGLKNLRGKKKPFLQIYDFTIKFFSKKHFVSFTKIVIIIFCLLKVLFDGLTTLKSMAEVNNNKF
jgi:hypothetical protein